MSSMRSLTGRRAAVVAFAAVAVAACSGGDATGTTGSGDDGGTTTGDGGASADATSDSAIGTDAAPTGDAQGGDAARDGATQSCGDFAGATSFTCSKDGASRGKCPNGALVQESCARGCLRMPAGQDSVCLGAADTDTLDCTGSYGTTRATDGDYYLTSFGCWVDPSNTVHTDPGDNCIPTCLAKAKQAGLCMAGDTGPQCEERVNWFTADGARFGCLARLKITNPANGKSVIAVALDYGPGCSVERSVNEEILDASGRVDLYLFGGDRGATDHATVHVVEVDPATPLGPVP